MSVTWLEEGFQSIWLPYAQMAVAELPLPVKSADGVRLKLEDGRELVDGIASWWSACHGYQHPYMIKAMENQLKTLSHVMFAGLAHQPAYDLAGRLKKITPDGLSRVFFSDSGSTAIEVAMKMAVQYWINKGKPQKTKFISFENSYHGDTMGAMSVSDPNHGMHAKLAAYIPKQITVPLPVDEYGLIEFRDLMESDLNGRIAAVIIEPLVQGAGGMQFYSADILHEIFQITHQNKMLFIADEVMTGFYRTGNCFACNEANISPDIMCLGKAITGGMIGLGATLASDEIFDSFLSDSLDTALMHGPTFMANPLACAAANASLDLFEGGDYDTKVTKIESNLYELLGIFSEHPQVQSVRVKGAIGVVEFKELSWEDTIKLRKLLITKGVWLRPFGKILYFMPSFSMEKDDIEFLVHQSFEAISELWG